MKVKLFQGLFEMGKSNVIHFLEYVQIGRSGNIRCARLTDF